MTTDNLILWNRLLQISNTHQNPDVKHQAKLLINQYNTAGGMRIKNEILNFLAAHETHH